MADAVDTKESQAAPRDTELPFQAEVQKILSIVIHSLYTNKEIFLRELVSNASDALDRARLLLLTRPDAAAQEGEPRIVIRIDEQAQTLTVEDNGVGMTRDEAIQNLGTIAHSGTIDFLKAYAEAGAVERASLIGQFGVGFYASFMVASRVVVQTRSMLPDAAPVLWHSTGEGSFHVEPGSREHPGTEITLFLKEEARQLGKFYRVNEIIQRYSDFVHFPIYVGDKLVNESRAIWSLPKSQVKPEQHAEFFRRVAPGSTEAMLTIHTSVDAPVQFHALLYVPSEPPRDLFSRDKARGIRLYAKRVLVMEDCERLIKPYMRFLRGVIDSEDLPLNISREMLQEDRVLSQIEQHVTKQVLKELKDLADSDKEKYELFWRHYGRLLKEGCHDDWRNIKQLADLSRFESLKNPPGKVISLSDYCAAAAEGQKDIFYVTGPNRQVLEMSPHIEAFRKKGIDVLLMTDPIDEWAVKGIVAYQDKKLKSITHGDVDLGEDKKTETTPEETDVTAAIEAVKKALGEKVRDVVISKRLTETASCLVAPEGEPGVNMERLMKMMNKPVVETSRILELNPSHRFVQNLDRLARTEPDGERIKEWAEMLLDQALLADGVVLDAANLVRRFQRVLVEMSDQAVRRDG